MTIGISAPSPAPLPAPHRSPAKQRDEAGSNAAMTQVRPPVHITGAARSRGDVRRAGRGPTTRPVGLVDGRRGDAYNAYLETLRKKDA